MCILYIILLSYIYYYYILYIILLYIYYYYILYYTLPTPLPSIPLLPLPLLNHPSNLSSPPLLFLSILIQSILFVTYMRLFISHPTFLLSPLLFSPSSSSQSLQEYLSVLPYTYLYSYHLFPSLQILSRILFPPSVLLSPNLPIFILYLSGVTYGYLYYLTQGQSDPACFIGVDG